MMSTRPLRGERRTSYNASSIRSAGLTVSIVWSGQQYAATLTHTDFARASLIPPRGLALEMNQTVVLRFEAPGMPVPLSLPAQVTAWTTDGGYQLELEDPNVLATRMPATVIATLNRRRAYRVAPDTRSPIIADVVRDKGRVRVKLSVVSLSDAGLAFFARTAQEQKLKAGDAIHISFSLPDTRSVCAFVGRVCYDTKQGSGVRYGVAFDPQRSPMFARQQRVIMRYVMQQQRKMLDAT